MIEPEHKLIVADAGYSAVYLYQSLKAIDLALKNSNPGDKADRAEIDQWRKVHSTWRFGVTLREQTPCVKHSSMKP